MVRKVRCPRNSKSRWAWKSYTSQSTPTNVDNCATQRLTRTTRVTHNFWIFFLLDKQESRTSLFFLMTTSSAWLICWWPLEHSNGILFYYKIICCIHLNLKACLLPSIIMRQSNDPWYDLSHMLTMYPDFQYTTDSIEIRVFGQNSFGRGQDVTDPWIHITRFQSRLPWEVSSS